MVDQYGWKIVYIIFDFFLCDCIVYMTRLLWTFLRYFFLLLLNVHVQWYFAFLPLVRSTNLRTLIQGSYFERC